MDDGETLSDHVAGEIRAILARRRITGRQLAVRLKVSRSWVSYRLTGTTEIGLNDLQRIAAALDIDATDLLPKTVRRDLGSGGGAINIASSTRVDQHRPDASRPRSLNLLFDGGIAHRPTTTITPAEAEIIQPVSPHPPANILHQAVSSDDHHVNTLRTRRPVWRCDGVTA